MKPDGPKLWIVKESRLRVIDPTCSPQELIARVFGTLQPGWWRVIPADLIDRNQLTKLGGFSCPHCHNSVRFIEQVQDYPGVHLYCCDCTAVVIAPPYDPLLQWHWRAFVGAQQAGPARVARRDDDAVLMGLFHDSAN